MSLSLEKSGLVQLLGRGHSLPAEAHAGTALRDDEPLFHELLDALPAAVYTSDAEGRITFYNEAAADLWGCRPERGRSERSGLWRLYWPDGRPMPYDESPMAIALKESRPAHGHATAARPDGARVRVLAYSAPQFDESGALVGAVNTLVDVTQRKQNQEAAQRFRFLAETMPQKIFTATANGEVDYLNQQWTAFTGLTFSQMRGWGWTQFVHPDDVEENVRVWRRSIETGEPFEFVHRFRRADGAYRWHLSRARAMRDAAGNISMWIGSNTEIHEQKEMEEALRQREEALRGFGEVLKALPAAVYMIDAEGRITFFNEAAAELWGRRPELGENEWCGSWRLYWPDGRPMRHDECPMAVALKEGRPVYGVEAAAERPDGTRVPFLAYPTPLRDQSGALTGAVTTLVDITERKRSERFEKQLAAIVKGSQDSIVSTDLDGIIKTWNAGAERLFGYMAEEVIGKPITVYIPVDHLDEGSATLSRIARGERVDPYETVRRSKDGSLVEVLVTPSPLKNAEGKLIGVSSIARDITDRKRAERSEQRLAAIVESSDDAIVSKDLDGVIKTWNPGAERLFGYTAQEVIDKSIMLLIPRDRCDEESVFLSRIRRGESIDHYETVRQRKDGSLVDISVTLSPLKDAKGRIIGASKIARDITEQRRAQEQQKLLLKEMSHRVKNLFAVASGLVTMSARSARTPADMAEAVRERLGALARAHGLTRPGLISGAPCENTTLHALVQTIFAPYVEPERIKGHGFYIVTGPSLAIGGNAVTSIALVLHELATNAVKYGALSTPGGYIHIDWSVQDDALLLTWKEHGGPSLDGPADREGFGGSLVRRTVTGQFDGQLSYDWKPKGLIIRLSMPVERLTM